MTCAGNTNSKAVTAIFTLYLKKKKGKGKIKRSPNAGQILHSINDFFYNYIKKKTKHSKLPIES